MSEVHEKRPRGEKLKGTQSVFSRPIDCSNVELWPRMYICLLLVDSFSAMESLDRSSLCGQSRVDREVGRC